MLQIPYVFLPAPLDGIKMGAAIKNSYVDSPEHLPLPCTRAVPTVLLCIFLCTRACGFSAAVTENGGRGDSTIQPNEDKLSQAKIENTYAMDPSISKIHMQKSNLEIYII